MIKYIPFLFLSLTAVYADEQKPAPSNSDGVEFQVEVETERKPWSHLDFKNDPDNFQFAIVSDRTGSVRPGVFPKALKRLNLLEPEFVITVGDLIVGNRKSNDAAKLHAMWDEMEGFISYLEMPFFYLAGNHDNGSPLLSKVWKERFGVEQYSFTYKNVLFLCLNAQDTQGFKAEIKKDQQDWAIKILKKHSDVRWTFVFIHQPVWMYEDGIDVAEANRVLPARETGWKPIEAALQRRPHTAFAGHVHQYVKYPQKEPKTNYYSLATTGGGSKMRGVDFGGIRSRHVGDDDRQRPEDREFVDRWYFARKCEYRRDGTLSWSCLTQRRVHKRRTSGFCECEIRVYVRRGTGVRYLHRI